MFSRREFLKKTAVVSTALSGASALGGYFPSPLISGSNAQTNSTFRLASFLEENPNAVFIKQTSVKDKLDKAGMEQAGKELAAQLFRISDDGWKSGTKVVFKPNIVGYEPTTAGESWEDSSGVVTNPYFIGGFVDGMRTFGPSDYTVLERAASQNGMNMRGYTEVSKQKQFNLIDFRRPNYKYYGDDELNWLEVANGYILKQRPVLRPAHDKDSILINMPTFKAHNLGIITLCCKGHQGMIPQGYGEFCIRLEGLEKKSAEQFEHYQPFSEIQKYVTSNMKRHTSEGYFRWESGNSMDELWVHYTLETQSAIKPNLCVVEGIVGRDGNAFGIGKDYLSNVILMGLSPLYVDMIGHHLAGHHPWNVGLFRIARERDFIPTVLPKNIDVYELTEKGPVRIENISAWAGKYPLGCAHHSNTKENPEELVFLNAPVTDDILKGEKFSRGFDFRIDRNYNLNSTINFSYEIENAGEVDLTLFDTNGRAVSRLVNHHQASGRHSVSWYGTDNTGIPAEPGTYAAQLIANGKRAVRKIYV